MDIDVQMDSIFTVSDNIIAKNIEGQLMIVPLISGVGNLDEEMFQLNSTGTAVWQMLDGKTRLSDIVSRLSKEYEADHETIKQDVIALMETLIKKNFIFKVK